MIISDTIVAQVTPTGRSGVSILRISGEKSMEVCLKILKKTLKPRFATYSNFFSDDNCIIDKGIAIWFPCPDSFTGEDVLELQGHGNPVITNLILERILTISRIRMADAGEFSKRAFLNKKIDLVQAESILDLIQANSKEAICSSLKSMEGAFSLYISNLSKQIIAIRTSIESIINFDEVSDSLFLKNIDIQVQDVINSVKKIKIIAKRGSVLREGLKIAIVGPPNSGKSSLFNALSLKDSAIVTNIKGTTRDVLTEQVNINGVTFCFSDTAGLRSTKNKIELIGIDKTYGVIRRSDHILLVIDSTISKKKQKEIYLNFIKSVSKNISLTVILNKSDLIGNKIGIYTDNAIDYIFISATKKLGFDLFFTYLVKKLLWNSRYNEGIFIAKTRHLNNINECLIQLLEGQKNWIKCQNIELLAENLRLAQNTLNQITGIFTSEDLLNNIFSNFCIGK